LPLGLRVFMDRSGGKVPDNEQCDHSDSCEHPEDPLSNAEKNGAHLPANGRAERRGRIGLSLALYPSRVCSSDLLGQGPC
jgi:hypothetical protein